MRGGQLRVFMHCRLFGGLRDDNQIIQDSFPAFLPQYKLLVASQLIGSMSQEPSNSASLARVVEEDVVESPAKRARTEEAAVNADESESPAPKDADTKSSGDEGSDSGEEKGQCWECKDEE